MNRVKQILLALTLTLITPAAWAQTISNPSFEANHYSVSPGYASGNGGVITGWTLSDPTRIGLNLGGTNTPGLFADNGAIPAGTNVAFIQSNGTTNSISTTISGLLPGAQYQVTFRANSRSAYSAPGARWSLNGGSFVPFTCSPSVGGSNPYYTNSGNFTASSSTAPLVLQNWVTNTQDGTVLLDAFSAKILPQTLIHYRLISTNAATVAAGSIHSIGTLGNGTGGGAGVTLTNDVPIDGVPPEAGDRAIVCNGSGGILAPDTEQLNRTNIANAGGFTYEAWFKWNGAGNINAIIDYAGTEKLIRRGTDPGPAMETDNSTISQIGAASSNQWHYVAVVFTATSSNLASDSVTGNYTFYLDTNTPTATVSGITINNFGDTLHQTIGVGTHPAGFASDYFNGLIFEPRISLGALPAGSLLFKSTYVVTSLADDGSPGTLGDAVANAATTPIIHFAPSLSGQTIYLTNGNVSLQNDVTIDGSGLPNGIHIDGTGSSQIFSLQFGLTAVLNSLTIQNGNDNDHFGGGGIDASAAEALTVNNCTFKGNVSNDGQDGGGALHLLFGNLTVNNCTFTGNQAINTLNGDGGGAIFAFAGNLIINGCTFIGNQGDNGGAIWEGADSSYIANTIACSNTASSGPNIYVPYGGLVATNNLMDTNALLAPLGNYGGPTQTMPPLPGSAAIDWGSDAAASLGTDQRGYPRIAGAHVDIGAVEGIYNAAGPGKIKTITHLGNGSVQLSFTNVTDAVFPVLASTNVSLPLSNWTPIGFATESPVGSGQFPFTDTQATNYPQRFYRMKSP
jgi:Concanavalin A-like lectin/glucanases superfamily